MWWWLETFQHARDLINHHLDIAIVRGDVGERHHSFWTNRSNGIKIVCCIPKPWMGLNRTHCSTYRISISIPPTSNPPRQLNPISSTENGAQYPSRFFTGAMTAHLGELDCVAHCRAWPRPADDCICMLDTVCCVTRSASPVDTVLS